MRPPDPPAGMEALEIGGAAVWADPAALAWTEEAIRGAGSVHGAASSVEDALGMRGRGTVWAVPAPGGGRWAVRRYRRGGAVEPLLGERYLRVGVPRPFREARASREALRRGVPTPGVVVAAAYPAGAFYRADLVTEWIPDSTDLARALFEERRGPEERRRALAAAGSLVARAAGAGLEHPDLNAMNVLLRGGPAPGEEPALLLDLDRCRVHPEGRRAPSERMLRRLERSLRKLGRRSGRELDAPEWRSLREAVESSPNAAERSP